MKNNEKSNYDKMKEKYMKPKSYENHKDPIIIPVNDVNHLYSSVEKINIIDDIETIINVQLSIVKEIEETNNGEVKKELIQAIRTLNDYLKHNIKGFIIK